MITYDEVIRLFKESVIFYPKDDGCTRLETFALVEEYSDFNSPTLAKAVRDINKPYYFSRKWAGVKYNPSKMGFDYPLLAMFETNGTVQGFTHKKDIKCYTFELIVVDKYIKDENQRGCANRTKQEVYNDTERALDRVLAYVSDVGYYVTTDHPNGIWLNRDHATSIGVNANEEKKHISAWWSRMLRTNNETNQMVRWEGGTAGLYGTVRTITLCLKKCLESKTSDFNEAYIVQNDKPCC